MARLLLKLGASSSQADLHGCTVFHRFVQNGTNEMIDTLWELDKTGVKAALNHLILENSHWNPQAVSPLHAAIGKGDTALVIRLLEAGANANIDFESWLRAAKFSSSMEKRLHSYEQNLGMYHRSVDQPLMVALRVSPDPAMAIRLLEGGADPNTMTQISYQLLQDEWQRRYNKGETALDVVRQQIEKLRNYTADEMSTVKPKLRDGMDEYLETLDKSSFLYWVASEDVAMKKTQYDRDVKDFEKTLECFKQSKGVPEKKQAIEEALAVMENVEALLLEKGAKTFKELHPDLETNTDGNRRNLSIQKKNDEARKPYQYQLSFLNTTDVTEKRCQAYEQL